MDRTASDSGRGWPERGRAVSHLIACVLILAFTLSGCVTANLSPEEAPFGAGQVNPAGANGLVSFSSPKIPAADLASQICPKRRAAYAAWTVAGDPLSDAITCFNEEAVVSTAAPGLIARRNAVLGYVMLRSDQACALWVTYIERAGSVNRGVFNITSVVTGGVGALVSGDASRILSGASGIASGTGAAIDGAILHGLTESLILPRVAEARTARRTAIVRKFEQDVATYPVTLALSDALDYHAACNVSSALHSDTPAVAFGQQMELLVQNAARVAGAKAALSGAREPTPSDLKVGAVFLTAAGEPLVLDNLPAAGAADRTVSYSLVGTKDSLKAADPDAFLALVKGGLVLRIP